MSLTWILSLNAVADRGVNTVVWLGTGRGPTELDARKAALKIAIERVLEEPRDKVLAVCPPQVQCMVEGCMCHLEGAGV